MADDFEYDVFLSHSPQDKPAVRGLAERLRADDLRVWFDEWALKPGDSVPSKIGEGLEHSRVLILCLSAHASGPDWPALESQTLRFRDPLDRERRFIPLRLDAAPVPASLAHFLPFDWLPKEHERTYARLREACRPPGSEAPAPEKVEEKVVQLDDQDKSVNSYAFSPDGKRVLSGGVDGTVRVWDVETGRCLRVLEGHTGFVFSVDWGGDQARAISGGGDVRVWDVETGRCLQILGCEGAILSVAFSPNHRRILSGGSSREIKLWDANTGQFLRDLNGHTDWIRSIAWGPDQRRALSGSDDRTVRVWDVEAGRCLRVLEGHDGFVYSVAWGPRQPHALSGGQDRTVRVWDVETGRCLRVLEGHTGTIYRVAWSPDQRRALSGDQTGTVRVWDVEAGRCLRVLEGHAAPIEDGMWLADQRRVITGDVAGHIRVWDLSDVLTEARAPETEAAAAPSPSQVQYTNAKVILVGDTGVGKSGLAERLVNKRFMQTKSSHARKTYVLESEVVEARGGVPVHQETVLWDLAGQPAYRLVHQLSMDDAALACVLFDCRSETNPFEGAAYWSQVLDQTRANTQLKKILVASRIDVGGLPAGRERVEAFAREHGFARFVATSAYTGEGCEELLRAIREGIPWDEIPRVTTTKTLAALREYVARLKGEKGADEELGERQPPGLLTVAALHEGFAAYSGEKIPAEEFVAHLQRLEATDALHLLVFRTTGAEPRPETLVLLDPTRIDAYASALLVAARDEPDGPGHLLESRVRAGDFKLDPEERLPDSDSERHVLWYVMENLLARDLALREHIKGEDYLVFPSQCTAELRFPGAAAFGVAFGFAGPVRGIYATLIAQLGHYEGFKKREFFQDAAAYRAEAGGRCLIRLRDRGYGQGELEVSFEGEAPAPVRQGFLEFVGGHLEARSNPGSVTRRHAYYCSNPSCRNPFEDRVVKARLDSRRRDLLCPVCEKKTPLVNLLASPTAAAEQVAAQIGTDAMAGRQRMTAAFVIKAKEAEGKFDVFLSHNSKDKAAVEKIAKRLLAVGLRPWLDKWNLSPGDTISDALEQAIRTIPCAALCFGPADVGKWHLMEMRAYVEKWAAEGARMIPVILPGVREVPELPLFVRETLWVDLRDWESEGDDGFYRLVCGILGKAPGDSPLKKFGVRDVALWQGPGLIPGRGVAKAAGPRTGERDRQRQEASAADDLSFDEMLKWARYGKEPASRQRALLVLAERWPAAKGVFELIRAAAQTADDPNVRRTALESLVRVRRDDPDTLTTLLAAAENDADAGVRRAAVDTLLEGWKNHPSIKPVFESRLAGDEDDTVRQGALEALCTYWQDELSTLELLDRVSAQTVSASLRKSLADTRRRIRGERITKWLQWLSGGVNEEAFDQLPQVREGFPALKVLALRLRNLGPFEDTGKMWFADGERGEARGSSLLLGNNAAGKSTLLRSIALAFLGPDMALLAGENAEKYLRHGSSSGSIEVLFRLQLDSYGEPNAVGAFAVGMEIRVGERNFQELPASKMSFAHRNAVSRLNILRQRKFDQFGFLCAYGALRNLTKQGDAEAVVPEGLLARVGSVFRSNASLMDPDLLTRLLKGQTVRVASRDERRIDAAERPALMKRLEAILPGTCAADDSEGCPVRLHDLPVSLDEISDGYSSLLGLVGHLLYHASTTTDWRGNPADVHGLVLVDEIDLHLHPSWQRRVMSDLQGAFPNLQVIATSHSPFVAADVPGESTFVLQRDGQKIRVLTDLPSVEGWRADQILTSERFGMETTRDVATERMFEEYARLLAEKGPEDEKVTRLGRLVASRLGHQGEGRIDAVTNRALDEFLRERFENLDEKSRQLVLASAGLKLSE